jgi:hypothetical protein
MNATSTNTNAVGATSAAGAQTTLTATSMMAISTIPTETVWGHETGQVQFSAVVN